MATITLSNYTTSLAQSSVGRTGTPTGNVFFDVTNGRLEIITAEELSDLDLSAKGVGTGGVLATAMTARKYTIATVGTTDFTAVGAASNTVGLLFTSTGAGTGTGTVNETTANPLNEDDGIKLEALYAFERQERRIDEVLRQYDYFFTGTFKFGGAYNIVNNRKFDDADGSATSLTVDDRFKIRGSGWNELDASGALGRIYYGNISLGNIESASQPYYQLANGGAPVNYDKDGPINEAVQVFGDIAIDTDTTTFDTRTYESLKIRTFGNNYDEKILSDSGVTEMGGYATGFALAESPHLTTGSYSLADVYGGSQIAPWSTMTLEELDAAQTETGFTTADGDFTWVVNNPAGGSLDQVIAYLDALAQTDDDINAHGTNVTNGKRVGVWYAYNAAGKILPIVGTGAASEGLFIEGLTGTDKNRVIFTDDADASKGNEPVKPLVEVESPHVVFKIDGLVSGTVRLIGIFTDQQFVVDTSSVNSQGEVIFSREEPYNQGLYYGLLTFEQLLNGLSNKGKLLLPHCSIVDWPDVRGRGSWVGLGGVKANDIDACEKRIKDFSALKLNGV